MLQPTMPSEKVSALEQAKAQRTCSSTFELDVVEDKVFAIIH